MSSLSQLNATPFIHPLPKPETTGLSWTPFFLLYPMFSPSGTPSSAFRRSPDSSHFSHAPHHHHLSPDSCRIPSWVSLLLFLPPFISFQHSRQGDPIKSHMSPSSSLLKSLGRLVSSQSQHLGLCLLSPGPLRSAPCHLLDLIPETLPPAPLCPLNTPHTPFSGLSHCHPFRM